ncbi:MAG: CRISPR-associated helicase Cas3' [Planctomycetaceae bacterium]|nr:CRISPR-associated helicase Cas3' [Planctomycetaceae bacterium]
MSNATNNSPERIAVSVLMGGEERADWHLYPERDAILIGTQDMLLSRALNRGYGASRFHWPIDFGLLSNDSLWVFDEPQLMANGVTTSAQLAGLRRLLGTFGNCPSLWMSATLEPGWLDTVDFVGSSTLERHSLGEDDLAPSRPLHKRMTATKVLRPLDAASTSDMKAVAQAVLHAHVDGTQTLVIVNTVDRAKATFKAINEQKKRARKEHIQTLLVHSRFRPAERADLNAQLQDSSLAADRIIVATQVVEAGVDLSARTLITELPPWASVVQRIGRCNRTGNDGPGQVFWIDLGEKQALPYAAGDLDFAREQLLKLDGRDVSPQSLSEFKTAEQITLPFEHTHVLRRRDLLDLFDTAPDLSGNDIDVQRFVRSDDPDIDVQVFWREISGNGDDAAPTRDELCSVPVRSFKEFVKSRDKFPTLVWDHLDDKWRKVRDVERDIRPGLTFLLPVKAGGYSNLGWDPDSTAEVTPLPPSNPQPQEGAGSDIHSAISTPLTITQHTQHVCDELEELLQHVVAVTEWAGSLQHAARWHDVGKAHWAFQEGVRSCNPELPANQQWAKSGRKGRMKHGRKYFRHELASALAALKQEFPFAVAYLIAAHHGRVRLSIRALPDEKPLPASDETLFALGVHDADPLPEVLLGGETMKKMTLDLSPMRLGGKQSWTARALKMLSEHGPFRLAYLEALLRAADVRASQKESQP